jgi:hypothetical protein
MSNRQPHGSRSIPFWLNTTAKCSCFAIASIILFLSHQCIIASDYASKWHWVRPLPQGNTLHDVTSANQKIVMVGERGTILTTPTNITTFSMTNLDYDLYGVATDGVKFIVVGEGGFVASSSDGLQWNQSQTGVTNTLRRICFGQNRFVVVGDQGVILFSTNGTAWSLANSGTTENLYGIGCGGNNFLAVGAKGTLIMSADGLNWSSAVKGTIFVSKDSIYTSDPLNTLSKVQQFEIEVPSISWTNRDYNAVVFGETYGVSRWIVGGDAGTLLSSDEAGAFQPIESHVTSAFTSLVFTGSEFLGLTKGGTVLSSFNGTDWTFPPFDSWPRYLLYAENAVHGDGQKFICVGRNGAIRTASYIRPGPNQSWWNYPTKGVTEFSMHMVTFQNNLYMGVGDEGIWMSTDGVNWTDSLSAGVDMELKRAAVGNDRIFVVGTRGSVVYKLDGSDIAHQSGGYDYYWDVCFGSTNFVAAQGTGFFSTEDGIHGTFVDLKATPYSVAFLNGLFVSVGKNGFISHAESPGIDWKPSTIDTTNDLFRVISTSKGFFAVGDNKVLSRSPDGKIFSSIPNDLSSSLKDLAYGFEEFVGITVEGLLVHSVNGSQWRSVHPKWLGPLESVAFTEDRFMAVGSNGELVALPSVRPELSIINAQNDSVMLRAKGTTGFQYQIESSENLQTWSPESIFSGKDVPESLELRSTKKDMFYRGRLLR